MVIHADVQYILYLCWSGWVIKNPELCWRITWMVPSSFSVLTQYPGLLAVATPSHQASQACQRSEKSVKTNSTIETTEWGHLPKINYSICSLASRHFSASVKKWVYYAMLSYCLAAQTGETMLVFKISHLNFGIIGI